jgi:hypothetical protein
MCGGFQVEQIYKVGTTALTAIEGKHQFFTASAKRHSTRYTVLLYRSSGEQLHGFGRSLNIHEDAMKLYSIVAVVRSLV